jgi:CRISPR-associated protein Cmr2
MKDNQYIAVTISPFGKTLAMAQSTRELYAASYLFSDLMKRLIQKLEGMGDIIVPNPEPLPKPDPDPPSIEEKNPYSPGLLPDRLILKINEKRLKEDFFKLIMNVKKKFIEDYFGPIQVKEEPNLLDHFQVHAIRISISDGEDLIGTIFPLLNTLEQKASLVSQTEINLKELLWSKSLFAKLEKENVIQPPFPTLQEISLAELISEENIGEHIKNLVHSSLKSGEKEIEVQQKIKEIAKEKYQFNHNYTAVVNADVDDLQTILRACYRFGNSDALNSFSKTLMEFGQQASNEINIMKGVPVYMGGDDMLFFSPVRNKQTIFSVIEALNQKFREMMLGNNELTEVIALWNSGRTRKNRRKPLQLPTISWGVALSYYKYPLHESLDAARALLNDEAKGLAGKNGIAFRLLKHSGAYTGATISLKQRSWKLFLGLIEEDAGVENPDDFLKSIQYKMNPLRPLLQRALVGRTYKEQKPTGLQESIRTIFPHESDRELMIKNLISNFFNEICSDRNGKDYIFLSHVFELLLQAHRDLEDGRGNNMETAGQAINLVYACLRIKQFYAQPAKNSN